MTLTAAFLILAFGIAIGYRLPPLVQAVRTWYRRVSHKPAVLRRVPPDELGPPH